MTENADTDNARPIDMDGFYRVDGMAGMAFRLDGYAKVWEPAQTLAVDPDTNEETGEWVDVDGEGEWVDDPTHVLAVAVGDDYRHTVAVEDLTPIDRADFCGECGQVGCTHDGLDRDGGGQ